MLETRELARAAGQIMAKGYFNRKRSLHASITLVYKLTPGRKVWKYGKLPLNIILSFFSFTIKGLLLID